VLLAAALAARAARLRMVMELLLQNMIEVVGVEVRYRGGVVGGKEGGKGLGGSWRRHVR
jgi:hypothetical protein